MQYVFSKESFWIKWRGFMLWAKCGAPLFSERNGIERFTKLPFSNWRFQLKRIHKPTTN